METSSKPAHIGRKISRIRELRNMKQDSLAFELGVSQQTVSRMEGSETVDDEMLEKVAKVLGVNKEVIKNFSEEAVVNYFNTFNDSQVSGSFSNNFNCTFNPLDKLMQAIEENKSLYEENKKLYERLLQSEQEKVEILMKSSNRS